MPRRVIFVPEPETLPINELLAHYPGEWCLVKILNPNMPFSDAPGQCLARGASRKALYRAALQVHEHDPGATLGVLHGDMGFGDGEAFRKALARINATGDIVTTHGW
jgi:hypothetical protein